MPRRPVRHTNAVVPDEMACFSVEETERFRQSVRENRLFTARADYGSWFFMSTPRHRSSIYQMLLDAMKKEDQDA
jgi:hypothetical protein